MKHPDDDLTGEKSDQRREYSVGYGKPPVETRFKKGERSRNPGGRPVGSGKSRKTKSAELFVDELFVKSLNERVRVRKGEEVLDVPKIQAALEQLTNKAASGDLPALKLVLERGETITRRRNGQIEKLCAAATALGKVWNKLGLRYRQEYPHWSHYPEGTDIKIGSKTGWPVWESPWIEHWENHYRSILNKPDRDLDPRVQVAELAHHLHEIRQRFDQSIEHDNIQVAAAMLRAAEEEVGAALADQARWNTLPQHTAADMTPDERRAELENLIKRARTLPPPAKASSDQPPGGTLSAAGIGSSR